MKSIDVLISTYGSRIYDLDNVLLPHREGVRYLISHQCHEGYSNNLPSFFDRNDVSYYKLDNLGVTKSRNKLIEMSSADIVYFCDDDIKLQTDIFDMLFAVHIKYSSDVITFSVKDETGCLRKSYPSEITQRNFFNILSVGTIEISIKRASIGFIRFPEDMGAGSSIPCGDEAVFLSMLLKKSKSIIFYPYTIAEHPRESSGVNITSDVVYSRGVTIRRVFGFKGVFLLLPFLFFRKSLFGDGKYYFYNAITLFRAFFSVKK